MCAIHKMCEYLHPLWSLVLSEGGKRKTKGTDVEWDPGKSYSGLVWKNRGKYKVLDLTFYEESESCWFGMT